MSQKPAQATQTATKSYYTNVSTHVSSGMKPWNDFGYSLDIPVNDIVTSGWVDAKPTHGDGQPMWGTENVMTTTREPEYYAPWGEVRSNVLPIINVNDKRFAMSRDHYSYKLW